MTPLTFTPESKEMSRTIEFDHNLLVHLIKPTNLDKYYALARYFIKILADMLASI